MALNDEQRYELATWGLDVIAPLSVVMLVALTTVPDYSTYVRFGPVVFHAFTLLILILAYFIATIRLQNLAVPWRELCACAMIVLGIHLYDTLWGLASVVARGSGFPWIPLISLAATGGVVLWLDSRLVFFKATRWSLLFLAAGVCAFAAMVLTGWYAQMTIYETVGGADPSNLLWLVGKLAVIIGAVFLTDYQPETKVIHMGAAF